MASTLLQRRPQRRVAGQAGHRQHQLGGTASGLPANTRVQPWVVVVVVVAVVACVPGVDGALEQAQVAAAMVLLSLPVTAVPVAVVVSVVAAAAAAVGL